MSFFRLSWSPAKPGSAAALAFLAAFLIAVVGGWQLIRGRHAALHDAEAEIRTLTRTLAQHAGRTIEAVDLSLSMIVDQVESGRDPRSVVNYFKGRAVLNQVHNLAVTDASGAWLADTAPPHAPISSKDRPYFLWYVDHDDRNLYFAPPVVGRTSNKPGLPVSRRINHPDGSFAGVAVAALAPEYFEDFYRTVRTGDDGTVALWREDGQMLARYPALPKGTQRISRIIANSAVDPAVHSGISRARSPWDGVERIFAFERVDRYPLVVSAAISIDDALSDWYREVFLEGTVVIAAATALVILGLVLDGHRRRLRTLETASQEVDRRYRLLADASSDMIQQLDLEGRRCYVSPSAIEIFGFPAADLVGSHPVDFIHPDDAANVGRVIEELAAGSRDQARSIYRIRHKLNHYVWVEVLLRLVRDKATGRPVEIVSTLRDITQREELRHQLESSNQMLLLAEEIAQVGHWRLDLPGNHLTWSNEVYRIHGRDPASFTPGVATAIDLYHPDDRAEVSRCVAEALAMRRSYEFALRILRPDGEVRHILSRGICEIGADGEVVTIFGTIMDVTALRQAEQTALESEARYRLLADNTTDMITHMNLTGQRLFVSPGSRDLLGYEPEELVGTSPQEMIHPEDGQALKQVFAELAAGRVDHVVHVNRLRHKDGRWIWVEASLRRISDKDGQSTGFVGAIRNITDRKRADEALQASEARYRVLAETTSDIITRLGLDFQRQYVSPACRAVLGYEPEEMMGVRPSGSIHPDDAPRVRTLAARLVDGEIDGDRVVATYRTLHKKGHYVWVETGMNLERDAATGAPTSIVSSLRDITARREAEQALAVGEARWSFALDSADQGVWDTNLETGQTFYSVGWKALLGYADHELETSSSTWLDLMQADDREAAFQANLDLFEGRSAVFDAEFRMRHKDGRWVWIHDRGKVVQRDDQGRPLRVIGVHTDVTSRKDIERELRDAKERAEGAARTKAEFLANMSHELRTPLTGIIGVHDLLRADPSLGAAQQRLIELASQASRSLLNIVNDVLDFSKIDAGQLAIETVPFDLDEILLSCRELAANSGNGKPVEITVFREPERLGVFRGDPTRIRQVLLNLLTNAVKFTPKGRVTIKAAYRADRAALRIEVLDSGIGIPADRLAALFERFTQADTSMTRRYGGTGLGLAICKRLVELMQGRIGAENRPEGGSMFWFEVPLAPDAGHVVGRAETHPVTTAFACRILLAEDSAVNAEIIAATLKTRGHAVVVVSDGAAAVEAARDDDTFDLVLMDMQMPVMDGLTATRRIRERETATRTRRVPIVALTANAMAEDAERCLAAGMDAHVAKPIDWRTFFIVLDRLVKSTTDSPLPARSVLDLADVLELERLRELSTLIGRNRLTGMLARFVDDLWARLDAVETGDAAAMSNQMHALVSTAGQFGFHELSTLCAELDIAARKGEGLDRVADLRRAAERATEAAHRSGFADVA